MYVNYNSQWVWVNWHNNIIANFYLKQYNDFAKLSKDSEDGKSLAISNRMRGVVAA